MAAFFGMLGLIVTFIAGVLIGMHLGWIHAHEESPVLNRGKLDQTVKNEG